MIYVTGDTHGEFDRIFAFCQNHPELSADDVMIVLGDAGVNYYEDQRDEELKEQIATLPLTLFMIHGNHEARPENMRLFSAHLHMDEATPHLHIDFVPFATGSKRGLDTRVSFKQVLAEQGFAGGARGDTEWNQWVYKGWYQRQSRIYVQQAESCYG